MNLWNKFTENFYILFIKNLFDYDGRASRREYIIRMFTISIIIYSIDILINEFLRSSSTLIVILGFLLTIIAFISFLLYFMLSVRRLHDFNYSGWWQLLILLPLGRLLLIVLACKKGTPTPNKYGEPPEY